MIRQSIDDIMAPPDRSASTLDLDGLDRETFIEFDPEDIQLELYRGSLSEWRIENYGTISFEMALESKGGLVPIDHVYTLEHRESKGYYGPSSKTDTIQIISFKIHVDPDTSNACLIGKRWDFDGWNTWEPLISHEYLDCDELVRVITNRHIERDIVRHVF